VKNPAGPQHSDDTNQDPEYIRKNIGRVFFKRGAPGKNHGIGRVKRPDKQKWTPGPKQLTRLKLNILISTPIISMTLMRPRMN
jgi:hypothetical protein